MVKSRNEVKLKLKSLVGSELVANDYVITWPDRHCDFERQKGKSHRTSTNRLENRKKREKAAKRCEDDSMR